MPAASGATWKYPIEMFEAVSTDSLWTGTKLMTLDPVIPLVPTAPDVL